MTRIDFIYNPEKIKKVYDDIQIAIKDNKNKGITSFMTSFMLSVPNDYIINKVYRMLKEKDYNAIVRYTDNRIHLNIEGIKKQ